MGYINELRSKVGTRPIILTGVALLVINEAGEILLQRRTDTGDWGTLGGSLELGESFEEAAVRELYEEAGLKTEIENLEHVTILSGRGMYFKYPNGDEVFNALVVYKITKTEGIPHVNDDEGFEVKYFPLNEIIDDLNPMAKIILKRCGYYDL
ncbi:MAG: NUDIX domain-containing protein [Clostridia bacterium]|nr:NUDIX domain-containing protein [Clostridia bacterium]